jgi:hypothetical protein
MPRDRRGPASRLRRVVVLAIAWRGVLGGEEAALCAPPTDLVTEEREIDDAVCEDSRRSETWNTAWAITFSIAAVGSASYAALAPPDWLSSEHRVGFYVTAVKATVGALDKLIDPLRIDVDGLCADHRPASARARQASLVEVARRERNSLTLSLLGGLTLNTAGLLYLGYERRDWDSAWISFGVGTAVAVAATLTAPVQSWLLRHRRGGAHRSVAMVCAIGPDGPGVALAGAW